MGKGVAAADGARKELKALLSRVFGLAVALKEGLAAALEGEINFERAEVDGVDAYAAVAGSRSALGARSRTWELGMRLRNTHSLFSATMRHLLQASAHCARAFISQSEQPLSKRESSHEA